MQQLSPEQLAAVARIAELKALMKDHEAEVKELYAILPLEVDKYPAGDYILKVAEDKVFDAAQAKTVLSAAKYKAILVPKPDSTKAKQVLTGAEYTKCQKVRGVKNTVVAVNDKED